MEVGERLRDLAAKIAIEDDHDRFTALVKELNDLLDEQQAPKQPPTTAPSL